VSLARGRARRRDYAETFATAAGRRVLRDLYLFCMQGTPTADPHEAVFAQGMQRVFRRIQAMTRLDAEALLDLSDRNEETDDA
jgi:hypothetical protein